MKRIGPNKGIGNQVCANSGTQTTTTDAPIARAQADTEYTNRWPLRTLLYRNSSSSSSSGATQASTKSTA